MTPTARFARFVLLAVAGITGGAAAIAELNLAERYPTNLETGLLEARLAVPWTFTADDVFELGHLELSVADVTVAVGAADVGIGHTAHGAVWAVVIPRADGAETRLTSPDHGVEEIAHVWLRFHPRELTTLFPPETVRGPGAAARYATMQFIARSKFHGSYHAGPLAMIPEPGHLILDVDLRPGSRRFFEVDRTAGKAAYVPAFAKRPVKLPQPLTEQVALDSFDQLWSAYDEGYAMFVLRPEVDWQRLRDEYRPQAMAARDQLAFAELCAAMLRNLRDLHIWVRVSGIDLDVYNRPRATNANPRAYETLLGQLQQPAHDLQWARTADAVGFVAIHSWSDPALPEKFDAALEQLRDTRGLIVDVRLNGGGSENLARDVAGRFAAQEYVYSYSQYRNGPRPTDLTDKLPRRFGPRGPWRYDRPVLLLIGQKCMSSNESFVAMMAECPQVTTLGDRTCGSSGNPKLLELPAGITVSMPRWLDRLPDGTPLDERGIQPDVRFEPAPDAFDGTRDELLADALRRIREHPHPPQPIAGPPPERPRVVSVWPPPDAAGVALDRELRLRFDRPMDPRRIDLRWREGAFDWCGDVRYDPQLHEFTIPVRLRPGARCELIVNPNVSSTPSGDSPAFASPEGITAEPYTWRFETARPTRSGELPAEPGCLPADGAEVALITPLRIRFAQPMDPTSGRVRPRNERNQPEAHVMPGADYDEHEHTFNFVLVLPPKSQCMFELHGFRTAAGQEAPAKTVHYATGELLWSTEQRTALEAAAQAPELLTLLENMQRARRDLPHLRNTVIETTSIAGTDGFAFLQRSSALFAWAAPDRFLADAGPYLHCPTFRIGADGQHCWWHYDGPGGRRLVVAEAAAIHVKKVSIGDPFQLLESAPADVARERRLEHRGIVEHSGRRVHVVRGWSAGIEDRGSAGRETGCTLRTWLIDAQTWLPLRLVEEHPVPYRAVRDFVYDTSPPSPGEFTPPAIPDLPPSPPPPLGEGFEQRFLRVFDGTGGDLSVRWGEVGPQSQSGTGLN